MTAAGAIRLLVVDDHTLFRRGLIALLSGDARFEVVAEAGDVNEAHRRAADVQPDVILLDNHMPGVNGVDALPGFKAAAPSAHVLMLTVSEDEHDLAAALRGGARGYLLKTMDSDMLATAILRTVQGESVISPEMTSKLVSVFQSGQGAAATPSAAVVVDPIQTALRRQLTPAKALPHREHPSVFTRPARERF